MVKWMNNFQKNAAKGNFAVVIPIGSKIQNNDQIHKETSATTDNTGRGDNMDDSTRTLLNRLDQDMRDHKQEMRDRDASILADAKERENRYREEMKAQDERWRQESKEREERIISALNDMKGDFNDIKEESRTTRNTVIGLTVSVILGVAAMVLAVIYGIK